MNLELLFDETASGLSNNLKNWIKQSSISNEIIITNKTRSSENTLGVVEILGVVLASKAVIELVKCINVWIKANRITATVKIKLPEKEIDLNFDNLKNEVELLNYIDKIVSKHE